MSRFSSRLFGSVSQPAAVVKSPPSSRSIETGSSPSAATGPIPTSVVETHVKGSGPIPVVSSFAQSLKVSDTDAPQGWRPWPQHIKPSATTTPPTTTVAFQPAATLKQISVEELLARSRTGHLNQMDILTELGNRIERRRKSISERERAFTQAMMMMEAAKTAHEKVVLEKDRLYAAYQKLLESHRKLGEHSKEMETKIGVAAEQCLEHTTKLEEAIASFSAKEKELTDLKASEAVRTQEFEQQKGVLNRKISELEASSLTKDSLVKTLQDKILELESCHEGTEAENRMLKDEAKKRSALLERAEKDLSWMLQKGLSGFAQLLLTSDEFIDRNTRMQEESINYGRHQGCLDTHREYSHLLGDAALIHDFPNAQQNVIDLFGDLVAPSYQLFQNFETGALSVSDLKSLVAKLPSGPEDVGESSVNQPKP